MQTIVSPRWIAWLKSTETRDPKGYEYIIWINAQWREWERLNGVAPKSEKQHEAFDAWLYGETT